MMARWWLKLTPISLFHNGSTKWRGSTRQRGGKDDVDLICNVYEIDDSIYDLDDMEDIKLQIPLEMN